MSASDVLTRAVGIAHATVDAYTRQREQVAADELNRLTTNQRYVVACQEALLRLANLCYVRAGSRLVNIDQLTWRIGVHVPWSRAGCQHYGLREWEATVLRSVMLARLGNRRNSPLFDFGNRRWYLNMTDYPTMESAVVYLDKQRLSIDEWLIHADALRESARRRMTERRGNSDGTLTVR